MIMDIEAKELSVGDYILKPLKVTYIRYEEGKVIATVTELTKINEFVVQFAEEQTVTISTGPRL